MASLQSVFYKNYSGDATPMPGYPALYQGPPPSYKYDNEMASAKYLPELEKRKEIYFKNTPDMYIKNPVADKALWNKESYCCPVTKTRNVSILIFAIVIIFFLFISFTK